MNDMDRNKALYERILEHVCSDTFKKNLQYVYTPKPLCIEMVGKLAEATTLTGKYILTFNLEFIEVLVYYYDVKRENIGFITDCKEKAEFLNDDRYKGVNIFIEKNYGEPEKWETNMKFDVTAINPPFNDGMDLDFIKKAMELTKPDGHILVVHPAISTITRKETKKFVEHKKLIDGHVKSIKLFNGNPVFHIGLFYPCQIIHIFPGEAYKEFD